MFSSSKILFSTPPAAHFLVNDGTQTNPDFVVRIEGKANIESARRQIAGQEPKLSITGIITKQKACYNPNYDYHFLPGTVKFFEYSIEVCDATFQYTQEHLDEAGGAFLPGMRMCPWGSELVSELAAEC